MCRTNSIQRAKHGLSFCYFCSILNVSFFITIIEYRKQTAFIISSKKVYSNFPSGDGPLGHEPDFLSMCYLNLLMKFYNQVSNLIKVSLLMLSSNVIQKIVTAHNFTQLQLNYSWRDLFLTKANRKMLGSRLIEKHLLECATSLSSIEKKLN